MSVMKSSWILDHPPSFIQYCKINSLLSVTLTRRMTWSSPISSSRATHPQGSVIPCLDFSMREHHEWRSWSSARTSMGGDFDSRTKWSPSERKLSLLHFKMTAISVDIHVSSRPAKRYCKYPSCIPRKCVSVLEILELITKTALSGKVANIGFVCIGVLLGGASHCLESAELIFTWYSYFVPLRRTTDCSVLKKLSKTYQWRMWPFARQRSVS